MKYGLDVSIAGRYSDPALLAEFAREAEKAGWDGFFLWDCVYSHDRMDIPVADPWISLAAIATNTKKIRTGALLTPLARRHPWKVARETATLDRLSGGRLVFGAALGYQALDFEPFGQEFDRKIRREKLEESLEIIDKFWRGKRFCFKGRHFQIDDAMLLPVPSQRPRIPVWIGGYWPNRKPFLRAARWDGLYLGTQKADSSPMKYEDVKNAVSFVRSQKKRKKFDIAFCDCTPNDKKKAAAIIEPYRKLGITWFLEGIHGDSPERMKERIEAGPLKID